MSNNVIVLGAGASSQAGIPLLAGFVDRMWEFSVRGRNGSESLSNEDRMIFAKAIEVRNELDGYHGRAKFDDRNLEDILSILSFNVIAGKQSDRNKLNWIVKAIARTIELTCTVKHDGRLDQIQTSGPDTYRKFWVNLFERFSPHGELPVIISFNYDLVLERALFQVLVNSIYDPYKNKFPHQGIRLDYHYESLPTYAYGVKYVTYNGPSLERFYGTTLVPQQPAALLNVPTVEILKLHGSLNFPARKDKSDKTGTLTNSVNDPYILPPIFNKLTANDSRKSWEVAMSHLRSSKNIIIVGYSLPRTDIYMQYFLKAALGPNVNLNRIVVFDPILFRRDSSSEDMMNRYYDCFSPQLHSRIDFTPGWGNGIYAPPDNAGTFEYFVSRMANKDQGMFF
jgi:hypothetical protein